MSSNPKRQYQKRVLMAKHVAQLWLSRHARAEYQVTVYYGAGSKVKNLPGLLKSFRDGKSPLESVPRIKDLGIETGFDRLSVWSSNRNGLLALCKWLEDRGVETSGVW